MKWHAVLQAIQTDIAADPVLVGIYGAAMRYTGSAPLAIPSLEFMVVADAETELWAPCTIQLDQWCKEMVDLIASEQRLRRMFHRELPTRFGGATGLVMWAQYNDGAPLTTPDRNDFFGRAIRFRFTPLRDLYEPVVPSTS
jgi:hypothetical protein